MESSLRALYFQCFQADYEVAKRAERCWSFERGTDASFIKFGAWDSSMRGLLSGERLYLQLKQMEQAFLEHQIRDFEITKNISLVQLDPLALIQLKRYCQVKWRRGSDSSYGILYGCAPLSLPTIVIASPLRSSAIASGYIFDSP